MSARKFTIVVENNRAKLPDVSKETAKRLEAKFSWVNCLNLSDEVCFYDRESNSTPAPMCHLVKEFVESRGVEATVTFGANQKLERKFNWKFLKKYRMYQEEAVDAAIKARYGIVEASPGAGKTAIASAITAKLGLRTAIIVQAEEPFDQAYRTLTEFTDIQNIGRLSGAKSSKIQRLGNVTVCMIQSLSNAIVNGDKEVIDWLIDVDVIIVDEAHHTATDTYLTALAVPVNPKYIIGVSATPEDREDGLQDFVHSSLGGVIYRITYAQLIDAGILVPITVYVDRMPEQAEQADEPEETPTKVTFGSKIVAEGKKYADARNELIYASVHRNKSCADFVKTAVANNQSCAVIVSKIDHANHIAKYLPDAVLLSSKTKNRKEVIAKLKNKEIMCVITTLFDEAVDVPSLGAVAILAGGKSKIKLKQRLRSLRSFDGETSKGYEKKVRGYAWVPYDRGKYVEEHSRKTLRELRALVNEHPRNLLEIYEYEK